MTFNKKKLIRINKQRQNNRFLYVLRFKVLFSKVWETCKKQDMLGEMLLPMYKYIKLLLK